MLVCLCVCSDNSSRLSPVLLLVCASKQAAAASRDRAEEPKTTSQPIPDINH
uniref:Uncharacterized protein n=1 Tax=Anopheles albimanus TaxID=7167 RepID=A0A182FYA5_ANOAL